MSSCISSAIQGGSLLGLSSSLLLLASGKVMGISGILSGLMHCEDKEWRAMFISGMITGSTICCKKSDRCRLSPSALPLSPAGLIGAGLLTGFGCRLGSGCPSGHAICGLPRRSVRSAIATLTFMTTGSLAAIIRHSHVKKAKREREPSAMGDGGVLEVLATGESAAARPLALLLATTLAVYAFKSRASKAKAQSAPADCHPHEDSPNAEMCGDGDEVPKLATLLVSWAAGAMFGGGLSHAGMVQPDLLRAFLDPIFSHWEPAAAAVLAAAVGLNTITFPRILGRPRPLIEQSFQLPTATTVTPQLVLGSLIFGVGWGTSGMCPGTAVAGLGESSLSFWTYLASTLGGMKLHHLLESRGIIDRVLRIAPDFVSWLRSGQSNADVDVNNEETRGSDEVEVDGTDP